MSQPDALVTQEGSQTTALESPADIIIYGGAAGSGKSYLGLLKTLAGTSDPKFNGIVFRRNATTLRDGLWAEAKDMYKPWTPKIQEQPMRMEFDGAVVKFNHLEHDKDAEKDHQGKQYSLVVFDEGCQFSEYQVTYLMSRLRSAAEGNSQMLITCNPDPDSFLCTWIDWWLDDDGYPIPERSGVIKYYCRVNGVMKFADTEKELKDNYSDALHVYNPRTGKHVYAPPKTMTFIGGTIFDNPALIEANPQYLSELNSLPSIEKARLLDGNWYVRPEGSSYYNRSWVKPTDTLPKSIVGCRAWDKASTEPSDVNKYPDYTACIKMYKSREGFFYIVGDYHNTCHDKTDPEVFGRFRETPGSRDVKILSQAKHDGPEIAIILPKDPAAAGATEYLESAKKLTGEGFRVQQDPMPAQTSKLTRYVPFSSACENGLVYILEHTFNKATLEHFHKENESFDGERSTKLRKDDLPDCSASAFNWLCKKAVIPSFSLEDFTRDNPFGQEFILAKEYPLGLVANELTTIGLNVNNGVILEDIYEELTYPASRVTYTKMWHDPTISAANHTIRSFVRKVVYKVGVDAVDPTQEQINQIEFIKSCMGDMSESFSDTVNESLSMLKYGFSVHEKVLKYRNDKGKYKSKFDDGRIGWAKLPIRSQDSLSEWIFDDKGRELKGVKQDLNLVSTNYNRNTGKVAFDNNELEIPRKKFMLFRHNVERNNPEGTSPLKACYIPWKYKSQIEEYQSAGISRDLGGLPVIKLPPEYMSKDAPEDKKAVYEYYKNVIRNLHANEQAGLILPKYVDEVTKADMFEFELVSVNGGKMYDTVAIINSYENKILMTYLADVLKLGQDASGSFALSDNKTNLLAVGIKSVIEEILQEFNKDLIPQTLVMNGWKRSNDMPKITIDDFDERDLDDLGKFIQRCVSVKSMEVDQSLSDWLRSQAGAPPVDRSSPLDEKLVPDSESKAGEGMKTAGEGTSKSPTGSKDSSTSNKENA